MDLRDLGWTSFFEEDFVKYKSEGYFPARVFLIQRDQYLLYSDHGELAARLAGLFHKKGRPKNQFPAVGDWVAVQKDESNQSPVIRAVLQRHTVFSRKVASGRKRCSGGVTEEQVIAANIDMAFIVMGLDRDFNVRRVERYLTLVYNSGAQPVIILNKADLCDNVQTKSLEVESVAFGVPIHVISATKGINLEDLRAYFETRRTISLVGSSGVGKSTIINALLGEERQEVGEISRHVGKGIHTTTHRELILVPGGGLIMDNPGMREIQLWGEEEDLETTFQDIHELAQQCRFNDCQHVKEPDCAVKEAVEQGELDFDRYQSFLKLRKELWFLEQKKSRSSRQIERAKWEKILINHNLSLKQMARISKTKKLK